MNVKGIRLLSGEDIIAGVTENRGTLGGVAISGFGNQIQSYILSKPAQIMIQAGAGGRPQMGLGDFIAFAKEKQIEISADKVVFVYDPVPELINAYNTTFGSGIVVATNSLTIPS
jgi:hypothetical protein